MSSNYYNEEETEIMDICSGGGHSKQQHNAFIPFAMQQLVQTSHQKRHVTCFNAFDNTHLLLSSTWKTVSQQTKCVSALQLPLQMERKKDYNLIPMRWPDIASHHWKKSSRNRQMRLCRRTSPLSTTKDERFRPCSILLYTRMKRYVERHHASPPRSLPSNDYNSTTIKPILSHASALTRYIYHGPE